MEILKDLLGFYHNLHTLTLSENENPSWQTTSISLYIPVEDLVNYYYIGMSLKTSLSECEY